MEATVNAMDILVKLKPILLKVLTGVITLALIKLLPKAGVPLSPDEVKAIAGFGAAAILGIGINWAAKTHATISADAPATAVSSDAAATQAK